MNVGPFSHSTYLVKKQVLKLFGGTFRVYDPSGALTLFASMKAFKLKEDIRIYTEEEKRNEVLTIKARSIIDFSAAYDVFDTSNYQSVKVGALKRKGWKSMIQDEWIIMNAEDQEIGIIREDSTILALLRRFATNLIPQNFHGQVGNLPVLKFSQNFNPFVLRLSLDFSSDTAGLLDRRLGIAAAVLLCAIEGRQD